MTEQKDNVTTEAEDTNAVDTATDYNKKGDTDGKEKEEPITKENTEEDKKDENQSKDSKGSVEYSDNDSSNKEDNKETLNVKNKLKRPLTAKEKRKRAAIISLIVIAALGIIYLIGILVFNNIFLYNTVINDTDVSFRSVAYVSDVVENQVNNYRLEIVARDGKKEFVKGSDINIKYIKDDKVKNLLKNQEAYKWPITFFTNAKNNEHHATVEYNQEKLNQIINSMYIMDKATWLNPINAYPKLTDNGYVVQEEVEGTVINTDKIYQIVSDAVTNTKSELVLAETEAYVRPAVLRDAPDLVEQVATYNQWLEVNITYDLVGTEVILKGSTILKFFDRQPSGELTLNGDKVAEYIKNMALEYNSVGTTRKFRSVDGAEYEVTGGTYGFEINQQKELEALLVMINNKESARREVEFTQKGAVISRKGEPDWGNTYIELNLTKQHMYYIKDGQVLLEADVVTGTPNSYRTTPDGVFDIMEKKKNAILVGEIQADGQPEYRTPVAYWLRVTRNGVGFHTATWQPAFGGNVYTWNGSHGCINMSYQDSENLFNLCDVGTPVISHY